MPKTGEVTNSVFRVALGGDHENGLELDCGRVAMNIPKATELTL